MPTAADRTARDRSARQRELRHAQRVLERELSVLLRPEQIDRFLVEAVAEVAAEDGDDPARRLRALVGARLLDAVGDLLGRVAKDLPDRPQREATGIQTIPRGEQLR